MWFEEKVAGRKNREWKCPDCLRGGASVNWNSDSDTPNRRELSVEYLLLLAHP